LTDDEEAMFGITIPPGIDIVRIHALSGRKGKPPCLWEGAPAVDQASIEAAIGSDVRVRRWLDRNQLIQNGAATLNLQIDCFNQGKRVESFTASEVTFLVSAPKQKRGAGDEVALRAFDMAEHVVDGLKEMLEERDTVIGRLVERGLKQGEPQKALAQSPAAPEKDTIDDLLDKGTKFLALAQTFRSMRGQD
jgi:hypothetical protein